MVGTQWSNDEEKCFWGRIIPISPARGGADRSVKDVQQWSALAAQMQEWMGDDARRRYTAAGLYEHLYQNVQGCFSPNARTYVRQYLISIGEDPEIRGKSGRRASERGHTKKTRQHSSAPALESGSVETSVNSTDNADGSPPSDAPDTTAASPTATYSPDTPMSMGARRSATPPSTFNGRKPLPLQRRAAFAATKARMRARVAARDAQSDQGSLENAEWAETPAQGATPIDTGEMGAIEAQRVAAMSLAQMASGFNGMPPLAGTPTPNPPYPSDYRHTAQPLSTGTPNGPAWHESYFPPLSASAAHGHSGINGNLHHMQARSKNNGHHILGGHLPPAAIAGPLCIGGTHPYGGHPGAGGGGFGGPYLGGGGSRGFGNYGYPPQPPQHQGSAACPYSGFNSGGGAYQVNSDWYPVEPACWRYPWQAGGPGAEQRRQQQERQQQQQRPQTHPALPAPEDVDMDVKAVPVAAAVAAAAAAAVEPTATNSETSEHAVMGELPDDDSSENDNEEKQEEESKAENGEKEAFIKVKKEE